MRLLRLPALPLLLLPLLAACTSGSAPAGFRPPATASFTGSCALVADDVVALGRLAHDLRGEPAPGKAAADALAAAQDRVSAVAETADPASRPALQRLVLAAGLVRIQAVTGRLQPDVVAGLGVAYRGAVTACGAGTSARPSPA